MTLLALAYRRASAGPDGNSPAMLDEHFAHIAANYENVLPGERLLATRDSICLVFDGGFFDFHAVVLPLLRKHQLRAVLAVAPAVVRDHVTLPDSDRLGVTTAAALAHLNSDAFCTWPELLEIVRSDHVAIAAHGYTHRRLDRNDADTEAEVHVPRTLLGTRLDTSVETFVFPYGCYTRRLLQEVRTGYDFVFGNGGAVNRHWRHPILYRIKADNLTSARAPFAPARLLVHRTFYLWNRLRRA